MKLSEFGFSEKDVQEKELYAKGVILAEVELPSNDKMILYRLHDFYVEVEYCKEDDDYEIVSAFKDTDLLEDYIPYMDVTKNTYQ